MLEAIAYPELTHYKDYKSFCSSSEMEFDVILLDISLPDNEGSQLIKDVTKRVSQAPIIVLTGYPDFDFARETLAMGVSDYLVKDELNSSSLYKSILYSIERNKALRELQESERRYNELFHISPLPMWVFDIETFKFLDVNEAAIDHYGYSEEEFFKMKVFDIRPNADIQVIKAVVKESTQYPEEKALAEGIFRHQVKGGRVIHVEVSTSPLNFKNRDARLVLARDITDQLEFISVIEDQNQMLQQIAWTQSHMARAPLSRIMGLIELLSKCDNEEEKLHLLQMTQDAADELDKIIKEIAEKSGYNPGKDAIS